MIKEVGGEIREDILRLHSMGMLVEIEKVIIFDFYFGKYSGTTVEYEDKNYRISEYFNLEGVRESIEVYEVLCWQGSYYSLSEEHPRRVTYRTHKEIVDDSM